MEELLKSKNGQAVIVLENGDTVPAVSSQGRNAVIVNANEIGKRNSSLKSLSIITGLSVGATIYNTGTFKNSNYDVTHIAGTTNIKKDTIIVNCTKQGKINMVILFHN
jgi:hypothetical protein